MTNRGVSPRTVRYTHSVLSGALKQSVRWQRLARDPAALVDLPRQPRREMRALDQNQAQRFIRATAGDDFEAFWLVLISLGLRPSEALALKWADLDGGRVHVQRALTKHADGSIEFNEPKTARGRRVVTLPESTAAALQFHRQRQVSSRLLAGPKWLAHDLIFATRDS